ncbi:hypothetical protein MXB_89, partial [Myxobolus squamalis]
MGVKGLWKFLQLTIAIDISIWIHRLLKVNLKNGHKRSFTELLILLYNKLCEIVILEIKPIFVFDGSAPELKKRTLHERRIRQETMKKRADNAKLEITKAAIIAHATSSQSQPFLNALKNINAELDQEEPIKIDKNISIRQTDHFYIAKDIQRVSIESEEFNSLETNEKYEYLSFLHDLVKYDFQEGCSHSELSIHQVDKFIMLGKINKKIEQLSNITSDTLKRKSSLMEYSGASKVHNHQIFSSEDQYYLFLKQTGLIQEEDIIHKNTKLDTIINPSIKFNSLCYATKNKTKPNKPPITPQPLSSSSSTTPEESIQEIRAFNNSTTTRTRIVKSVSPKIVEDVIVEKDELSNIIQKKISPVEVNFIPKEEGIITDEPHPIKIPDYAFLNDMLEEYYKSESQSSTFPKELLNEFCAMISLFGMAYIVAPCEAEAQCAALESMNLCDLIATEDSDCFLFGGKRVIKGLFSVSSKFKLNSAHVDLYDMSNISQILGLNRQLLISMAMLSGCDYTDGLKGVGIITAYKLITEFYNPDSFQILLNIKNDSLQKLKNIIKTKILPNFPNELIYKSFMNPLINNKIQKFDWKNINYEVLKKYMKIKLGFDEQKIDDSFKILQKFSINKKHEIEYDFQLLDECEILLLYNTNIQKI